MNNFRSFIIFLSLLLAFYSCRATKPVAGVSQVPTTVGGVPGAYIDKYKNLAMSEMNRSGIPASITLAQGMLESDYGRSRLAVNANNHFGIKCHNGWKGATISHNDDKRNECFRKYKDANESFFDHSNFLTSTARYKDLFKLKSDDYKGWAKGLKQAGYATNPKYADLLINKIEEYELWRYDKGSSAPVRTVKNDIPVDTATPVSVKADDVEVKATTITPESSEFAVPSRVSRIKENNRIQYIIVNNGDTRESIEKEFNLLRRELLKYNELENGFEPVPGQILYLQPKRDKADVGNDIYNVKSGDSMYSISQKYGIKLHKLYEMNRMQKDEEPKEGDKLWLRGMKPVS